MDAIILRSYLGVVAVALVAGTAACSVVVDTTECLVDADCDFEDSSSMQCVSNVCVPLMEARQALVPTVVREDLLLDGDEVWVFAGETVIEPHATLVVADASTDVRAAAVLSMADASQLVCHVPCPELLRIVQLTESP